MKLTLAERLSESLYDPAAEPGDTAEFKAAMTQMVATMLIGAPLLLAWAFVYLYFAEIGAFIVFTGYAIVLVILLALMSVRRMRGTRVRNLYLGTHLAAVSLVILALGGIANSTGVIFFILLAPFSMITQPTRQFLNWFGAAIGLVILAVPRICSSISCRPRLPRC